MPQNTTPFVNGISELMKAASQGNFDQVKTLVLAGAELDYADIFGHTALFYAVSGGHYEVVAFLLAHGADVRHSNPSGASLMSLALGQGREDIVQLLINALMFFAVREGDAHTLSNLLEEGADINARSAQGWTALMMAAATGHLDTVRVLFNYDADATVRDAKGWTAYKLAAFKGHHQAARFIERHLPTHRLQNTIPFPARSQAA